MSALVSIVLSDPVSLALIVLGVLIAIAAVVWAARTSASIATKAAHLLHVTMEGRPEEARVRARHEGRNLAPVLAALGGEVAPPSQRPLVKDLVLVALVHLAPMLLGLNGIRVLRGPDAGGKIEAAAALLFGLAILLPLGTLASITMVELSRRSARNVRASCIAVLAKSVKSTVDSEVSDALRRGNSPRDPRGD